MYCFIPLVLGFIAGRSCGYGGYGYGNYGRGSCGCGCGGRRYR
ncbi:MAG TPA: hypothetical protein PKA19_04100 [Bacillota bacterium]|nr:hypothetical protein [Bacillota bacterium]